MPAPTDSRKERQVLSFGPAEVATTPQSPRDVDRSPSNERSPRGGDGDGSPRGGSPRRGPRRSPRQKGKTAVAADHPQRAAYLDHLSKPASGLESWFDHGLKEVEREDGEVFLSGIRRIPLGYSGCDGTGSSLIYAERTRCRVWPIRFDLGDAEYDTKSPWTLYHYTNKACFERIMRFCTDRQGDGSLPTVESISDILYREFLKDFQERCPDPSQENPDQDLELMVMEPTAFGTNERILEANFRWMVPKGRTKSGHPCNSYADFCIPVRVPHSAVIPIVHGNPSRNGACVRVDLPTLVALQVRGAAQRELARRAEEAAASAAKEERVNLSWTEKVFGWKTVKTKDASQKRREALQQQISTDRVVRDKRIVSIRAVQLMERWAKDHFAFVKQQRDAIEAKEKAADDLVKAVEAKRAKRLQKLEDDKTNTFSAAPVKENDGASLDIVPATHLLDKLKTVVGVGVDMEVIKMYKNWKEREHSTKDVAIPPLASLKQLRSRQHSNNFIVQPTSHDGGSPGGGPRPSSVVGTHSRRTTGASSAAPAGSVRSRRTTVA